MSPFTEQEYKIKIEELQKEIEILKKKQTEKMKSERYGLNWIDVPEAFEKESENKIPVLKEVKDKAIKNEDGKPTHILIEGDNYHALKCLNYTHAGKIDVIYIDPPYNTGSDGFIYKDARFLEQYPDGTTIPKEHPLRHSTWLSFMSKRLKLAKNLLSEKGVIFISIDDNEQANLKLLCDQVFGEENFVGELIWQKKKGGSNDSKFLATEHEYILMYGKKKSFLEDIFIEYGDQYLNRYREKDEKGRYFWDTFKRKSGKQYYAIECPDGTILENDENGEPISWLRSKERFLSDLEIGEVRILQINNKWTVHFKQRQPKGYKPRSLVLEEGTTSDGAEEVKNIFKITNMFENPKPSTLISFLLKFKSSSSTILDFFAGSGTTLHATMKLNAEDGGNRQCILVQQKETDSNICESITYERNRRVMQGYTNSKGEEIPGLGNSLKYYKTDFIGEHSEKLASDEDKILLAQKAGCLISLSENTLEEIKTTEYYQLYTDGKKLTAIYFNEDPEMFPDFVEDIAEVSVNSTTTHKTTVYVYCEGNPEIYENEFDDLTDIEIKAIPHPILQIYKTLNEAL